jgi:hypothetical protein
VLKKGYSKRGTQKNNGGYSLKKVTQDWVLKQRVLKQRVLKQRVLKQRVLKERVLKQRVLKQRVLKQGYSKRGPPLPPLPPLLLTGYSHGQWIGWSGVQRRLGVGQRHTV